MAMLRSFLLLFIIFSMGNAKVDLSKRCPYGWQNFGLRCYKYYPHSTNWITAERNCHSVGANLASVRNAQENIFLLSLLPYSTRCWGGAHDAVQERHWVWSDGNAFLYTHWCPKEPNNSGGSENCLEINWTASRCWNDTPCSNSLHYICVKDL